MESAPNAIGERKGIESDTPPSTSNHLLSTEFGEKTLDNPLTRKSRLLEAIREGVTLSPQTTVGRRVASNGRTFDTTP